MSTINQEVLTKVRRELSVVDNLKDRIEILANTLIIEGVGFISDTSQLPKEITFKNVVEIVMEDKKKNGETIGNALALQGMLMLEWLDRGESNE